jgi:hypothetical protein
MSDLLDRGNGHEGRRLDKPSTPHAWCCLAQQMCWVALGSVRKYATRYIT